MKRDYPKLCEPLQVGNLTFRNRMTSAPMGSTDIDKDGTPGLRTQGFYEARAKGGAASVTVSELVVHPKTDGSQMLHLSLSTVGQLGAFAYVADAIKRHGAIASIELSHSGQYAGTYMVDKKSKAELCQWGPSDAVRSDGMQVRALSKAQIDEIVAAYADAAALSKRAGFQMCMLHAGHGWLLNQFLSPYFNKREDEYGGSLENRTRLTREILIAIREATGPDFPIELRMSGSELFDGGYDLEEGCRIARELEPCIDLLHVSAGSYQFGFSITHPSMFRPHGVNVHLAEEIKKHVSVPVVTIGALSDPAQMEDIVASGKADAVAMARGLLADPDLPNKVMANCGKDVVKCVRCFVCMAERPVTQTRRCAVNPLIGREFEGLEVTPAQQPKTVLVARGGIAGLKSAHTAKLRGHEVILCEASDSLGGVLNAEKALPFKYDMYELGQTYAGLCREAGVDIRLDTPVTPELCDELEPDALIIAVGSTEAKLPIPVSQSARVLSIDELYLEGEEPDEEVCIIGGGLTGCECAIWLAQRGHIVHLIHRREKLAPDANIRNRPILLAELEANGVDMVTGASAESVEGNGVIVRFRDDTTRLVPGQTVVAAVGRKSRIAEVDSLRNCAPFVRVVGDAIRPANVCLAIYEGYHAALDI